MQHKHQAFVIVVLLVVGASTSHALQQPNGAAIPSELGCDSGSPTGLAAALACECDTPGVCNIGAPCANAGSCPPIPSHSCETTLWHSFNDNTCIPSNRSGLDPWSEASLDPETYMPTCALTFTVVGRGTAIFGDIFGWYNVTGSKPDPSDLHVMLDCNAARGTSVVLDVRGDPAYAGGEIGFFIGTPEGSGQQCAQGNCCASLNRIAAGEGQVFYSERDYNPDASGADSIIHLVVLDSHLTEHKFYFAWEDIFGGSNNDFTDLITSVEGVECSAGGGACDTGQPGICANGILTCDGKGVTCSQLYQPREERCDGADNDCDGAFDEGDVCQDDVVASCEGVECVAGQFCRDGACVDACAHVECAADETCRGGACFPGCNQCNGIVCDSTETCNLATGDCDGADSPEVEGPDAGSGAVDPGPGTAVGCSCQAAGSQGASALLWALFTLWLIRRRRPSNG